MKYPKDINRIMTTLTNKGYDVYCAGQCVVASYLGQDPQDWDLYTNCPQDVLQKLFPDGEALGRRVTRLDYTQEVISEDINVADSLDGIIADLVTMEGSMEEQLEIYDLTVDAIAENPQRSTIDPYGGGQDIKDLLLKPMAHMEEALKKDPAKIMKVVKYVALYNFDLHKSLAEMIQKNAALLQSADKEDVLYELMVLINGEYAGKALKMIAGLGLLPALIGERAASLGGRAMKEYEELAKNIHKTKQIPLRRLAIMYLCFDKYHREAVEYLPHEELDREYLVESRDLLSKLHFAGNDVAIKQFLYRYGWEKFRFMDKLAKAQAIVYDYSTQKIEGREHILKLILEERQPIFVEDLAIDANDIMEAGITDDAERAEYLLSLLPDVIHQTPKHNERKALLKYAARFNRSKISAAFRGVKWLR